MIWLGIAALLAAGFGGYKAWSSTSKLRAIKGTETSTVADLRARREGAGDRPFRQQSELIGQALPHKDGALRAGLSGEACVWHKHKITRKFEDYGPERRTGRRGRTDASSTTRTEVTAEQSTTTAFFLQDATGKMVVQPGKQDIEGAEKVLDRFEPGDGNDKPYMKIGPFRLNRDSRGRTIGFKQEEWIVRPGSPMYVLGEARAQPGRGMSVNAPSDGGHYVLSVKSEKRLRRGEQFKSVGFGLGAVAAAIGGVVLLVMGVSS